MKMPVRLVSGGWPKPVERLLRRFCWADPRVIDNPAVSPEQFRDAMKAIHVGDTYKITGKRRHATVDALLVDNVGLAGATVLDIGASDGSTSVALLDAAPQIGHLTVADLYVGLDLRRRRGITVMSYPGGAPVLVVSNRLLAWPEQSRLIATLLRPVVRWVSARPAQSVSLLGPEVRARIDADARVSVAVHDIFTVWKGDRPDVIKVANLLRRLYFSDERLLTGLECLHASLADGGHLVVLDNPRIEGIAIRGGVYRRTATGFDHIASVEHRSEIDDLISRLAVDPAPERADSAD